MVMYKSEWNGVEGLEESKILLLVAIPEEGHEYDQRTAAHTSPVKKSWER